MTEHASEVALEGMGPHPPDPMHHIWEKVKACMQCGTCTGSCVNSLAMDITPRTLWRLVQFGLRDEIFNSQAFWLCSSCYYCTLRCPRGLPLTEAMGDLKRLAVSSRVKGERRSPTFYRVFLEMIRRYGRVREMEMMGRYFLSLKNPIVPIAFTPLGVKLLLKGKVFPQIPSFFGAGKLDAIYRKAQEVEAGL